MERDWINEQKTYTWSTLTSGDLMSVAPGQTVTVSIEWNGTALIFRAWDPVAPGTVYSSDPYVPGVPVYPPTNPELHLQARINLTTDTAPTFQWTKVPGATRYQVRIYNNDRSQTIWRANVGDTDSVTIPPGILKPDSYYRYRVDARDGHDGLWIGLNDWGIDNMSRTPASSDDYYAFYTGSQEAQDPFIDLDNSGTHTWTNQQLGGRFLSFWIKVHDAQGVPGNIDTVTVTLPGAGQQNLYYDAGNSYNTTTAGIYRSNAFPNPIPAGTYSFTVVDKNDNTDTVNENLTVQPVNSVDASSITAAVTGTAVSFDWADVVSSPPTS